MTTGLCNGKSLKYFGIFLAGAGIGAGFALLFAPKTGRDTRRLIARRAEDGKEYVSSRGRDFYRQAEGAVGRGKEWAGKFAH